MFPRYKQYGPIRSALAVAAVSLYLLLVLMYLLFTKKIVATTSLRSLVLSRIRRPYCANLKIVHPESGHCFTAGLPARLLSDREGFSRLVVFEDGVPLPRPHRTHDEIRSVGNGAYSHWGSCVFFSSADNSNPLNNGRVYSVREV